MLRELLEILSERSAAGEPLPADPADWRLPLPERLLPTVFILIAPPAVGFIAYVRLTGGVDVFAQIGWMNDNAVRLTG